MNCDEFKSILSSYPDGELNPDTEEAMLDHAASCDNCAEKLTVHEAMLAELAALDDDLIVPAAFGDGWRAMLQAEGAAPRKSRASRWQTFAMTAAAAVVLVLGTVLMRGGMLLPPSAPDTHTALTAGQTGGGNAQQGILTGETHFSQNNESAPAPKQRMEDTALSDQIVLPDKRPVVLHTVTITLQSERYDQDIQQIDRILGESNGWSEYRSVYGEPPKPGKQNGRYATLTVRVPMDMLESFVRGVSSLGRLIGSESTVLDISDSYYDTQGRLTMFETQRARLNELLGQAQNMADIIAIEGKLAEVQHEIESLTGTMNNWDSRANSAVVYVTLTEVAAGETKVPVTLWERLSEAVGASVRAAGAFVSDMLVFLVMAAPYILAAAFIAGLALLILTIRRKNRK